MNEIQNLSSFKETGSYFTRHSSAQLAKKIMKKKNRNNNYKEDQETSKIIPRKLTSKLIYPPSHVAQIP